MVKYVTERRLIKRGDRILLGLSGGADSICLLSLLSDISPELELKLTAVHVHHGIRGEEADRDAEFSRAAAEKRGVDFIQRNVDAPKFAKEKGLTLEEAARILRYSEMESILKEISADSVALAHHSDDQAETVLMNLFRGTGPDGLVGMSPVSGNRIRPLLFAKKAELLQYLNDEQIDYIEDSTNSDNSYTRNRIRNVLLPEIEKTFPDAGGHIAAAAEDIGTWQAYIRENAAETMREADTNCFSDASDSSGRDGNRLVRTDTDCPSGMRIPVESYLRQAPAIRHEWLRMAVLSVVSGAKDVGRTHYKMIDNLFTDPGTGREYSLPGGCIVRREYNYVVFKHKSYDNAVKTDELTQINLPVPGEVTVLTRQGSISYQAELVDFDTFNENKYSFFAEKDYTKYIDYGKIRNGLCVRHPMKGDYFTLNDKGERKRLNRFFIDRKVPEEERNCVIVADGPHVVWALDRLSNSYTVTERTESIVRITRRST